MEMRWHLKTFRQAIRLSIDYSMSLFVCLQGLNSHSEDHLKNECFLSDL